MFRPLFLFLLLCLLLLPLLVPSRLLLLPFLLPIRLILQTLFILACIRFAILFPTIVPRRLNFPLHFLRTHHHLSSHTCSFATAAWSCSPPWFSSSAPTPAHSTPRLLHRAVLLCLRILAIVPSA